jgi:hypothetical protein
VAGGFFIWGGTVSIVDVADPASPAVLGIQSLAGNPISMAVREPYVFVTYVDSDVPSEEPWHGVHLLRVDVSDPDAPVGVEIPHAGEVVEVAGLIYLFDGERLRVLDVAPDGSPITVSDQPFAHRIHDTVAGAGFVYALGADALHVVDVGSPRSPVVREAASGIEGEAMALDGGCLFVRRYGGFYSDLQVVDVTEDPVRPASVAVLRRVGGVPEVQAVAARGGRVYLASRGEGLTILAPEPLPAPTGTRVVPPDGTPPAGSRRLYLPSLQVAR